MDLSTKKKNPEAHQVDSAAIASKI